MFKKASRMQYRRVRVKHGGGGINPTAHAGTRHAVISRYQPQATNLTHK